MGLFNAPAPIPIDLGILFEAVFEQMVICFSDVLFASGGILALLLSVSIAMKVYRLVCNLS